VDVSVQPAADARRFPARLDAVTGLGRRLAVIALAFWVAIAAAAAVWLYDRSADRPVVTPLARERGPAGVAAAYGYPLDCLSITILAIRGSYARADFNHANPCGRYTGYPTAVFHYASGGWRPVLVVSSYLCPVSSLPVAVQTALDVCDRSARTTSPPERTERSERRHPNP
jgi:hypothetical protein